ncbi:CHAT domain-containing protein [Acinetobacter baumannii]|uniref:CHAT domain-containing protein n=1 Tax=Acinetobacter baumannii TaxID=470 RepID=UPI002647DCCF|nr:CHAT domain-containing protein [Acinetobacter baumannii]
MSELELIKNFIQNLVFTRQILENDKFNNFCIQQYQQVHTTNWGYRSGLIKSYLSFCISRYALCNCAQSKDLTEMHRWIVRALTDTYTGQQSEHIYPSKLFDFITDRSILNSYEFSENMVSWLGSLYYYCGRRAALPELASEYVGITNWIIREGNNDTDDEAFLISSFLGWLVQVKHELAEEITNYCESLVRDEAISKRIRCSMSLTLGTLAGRLSKQSYNFWAQYTLDNYYAELNTIEKLQMLVTVWNPNNTSVEEKIVGLLASFKEENKVTDQDTVQQRYTDRHFNDILMAVANLSIEFKNTQFITLMTKIWLAVEPSQVALEEEDIIWMSPFAKYGSGICFAQDGVHTEHDSLASLQNVTDAVNLFYGTSISVNGADTTELYIPDRYGYPNSVHAKGLEEAMSQSYFSSEICHFLESKCTSAKSQIIFQSKPYPFQSIQLKLLNNTWPLTASFLKPRKDEKVERVALWSGAQSATEEIEIKILEQIFGKVGISVDIFNSHTSTIEEFRSLYSNESYQVIWVMSHGEYDHFDSKAASIQISSDTFINLDDLLTVNLSNQARRLLFLNVCDGATHPGNELIPRLGFAAALARDNQATMSNLWPVEGRATAAFGAVYAINLAKGFFFFEAYKNTILNFIHNSEAIPNFIDDFLDSSSDLTDRLRATDIQFQQLDVYGAVAFYE